MAVITTFLLIQLHPQEKWSAAKTFLETREKSGLEAALVQLRQVGVGRRARMDRSGKSID